MEFTVLANSVFFLDIMFVLDLTDDLFKHVFNRDHACNTAVFIHDDSHVIPAGAKLLQQYVESLALRDKDRRAQNLPDIESSVRAFKRIEQQIFCQ